MCTIHRQLADGRFHNNVNLNGSFIIILLYTAFTSNSFKHSQNGCQIGRKALTSLKRRIHGRGARN